MFEPMDAVSYRALDHDAFEKRRASVLAELENAESTVPTADLEAEVSIIEGEVQRRNAAVNLRNQNLMAVKSGSGTVISNSGATVNHDVRVTRNEDPFDTEAYNRAFREYVTRGVEYPAGLVQPGQHPDYVREDAFTFTTDIPHFIPTTISRTIIEKMSEYGELWPEVTKMNVQGGLDIRVWDWLPTASWITESTQADYQKATDATTISFKYYMAEARVAQSFLASLTSEADFQRRYPEKIAEAMVRLLDQAIMNGTGSGQPLGILKDTRVEADNKVTIAAANMGKWSTYATILNPLSRYYRRRGQFIMNIKTWDKYINGMVDTEGQPVARVNYGLAGANDTSYSLMGYRVKFVEDDILPSYDEASGQSADTPFMLFMNLSNYIVNQQEGMRTVKWNDEEANLVKYKIQTVVDGKIGDPYGTMIFSAPKISG